MIWQDNTINKLQNTTEVFMVYIWGSEIGVWRKLQSNKYVTCQINKIIRNNKIKEQKNGGARSSSMVKYTKTRKRMKRYEHKGKNYFPLQILDPAGPKSDRNPDTEIQIKPILGPR